MLAVSGGGIIDVGQPIVQLEGEPEYKWHSIGGVHYPTRAFMADLIGSKWMVKTIQGKNPGDQQNYLTVPFSRTLGLTEPLPKLEELVAAVQRQQSEMPAGAKARL